MQVYLKALRAGYTERHQRSSNAHEQFLIEFHAVQIEQAIELMDEVHDVLTAEILWEHGHAP